MQKQAPILVDSQAETGIILEEPWEVDPLKLKREAKLGKGSSGDVFLACDTSSVEGNGRRLALKIVPITLKKGEIELVSICVILIPPRPFLTSIFDLCAHLPWSNTTRKCWAACLPAFEADLS